MRDLHWIAISWIFKIRCRRNIKGMGPYAGRYFNPNTSLPRALQLEGSGCHALFSSRTGALLILLSLLTPVLSVLLILIYGHEGGVPIEHSFPPTLDSKLLPRLPDCHKLRRIQCPPLYLQPSLDWHMFSLLYTLSSPSLMVQ